MSRCDGLKWVAFLKAAGKPELKNVSNGTKYSRMDQVKFVKDSL